MNLVLSHNDYPYDKSNSFLEIENIDKVPEDFRIYYANVKKMNKVNYIQMEDVYYLWYIVMIV